jgi:DNA-binding CsgD family transcriptional regulator/PAS domain-containing protein
MSSTHQDTVLELVGQIYEAAVEPEIWPSVLARLASETESENLLLSLQFPCESDTGRNIFARPADPEFIKSLQEHYWNLDPWRPYNLGRCTGEVELGRIVLSHAELVKTEFYNDWMRPQKFHDTFAMGLAPPLMESALAGFRKLGTNYDDGDLDLLRALTPHLRQAVVVDGRLHQSARETDVLEEVLDHLSTGVIVLDAKGRVLRTNRAADRILANGDGLSLCRNELATARPADACTLRKLIGGAAQTGNGNGLDAGGSLALERPSGRRSLTLLVSPVRSIGADTIDGCAAALVFVGDPEQRVEPPIEALRRLWGLTRAEARVASLLMAGERLEDIAEQLRVQTNTARAHLKQVFAKTETHRQAELVVVLLRTLGECPREGEG